MGIRTKNVSDIENAIKVQLENYDALENRTALRIERDSEPSSSETETPWIGIYRLRHTYEARTLGIASGFRHQLIEFVILCKESHSASGEDCANLLDSLVQDVTSALLSDPSLQGTVNMLDPFEVQYPNYTKSENGGYFFQTAAILFTARTVVDFVP